MRWLLLLLVVVVACTMRSGADAAWSHTYTGSYTNASTHCLVVGSDSWVHDADIGPCSGDGIKVVGATNVRIGPNVTIHDAENSVSVWNSNDVGIDGLTSVNPTNQGIPNLKVGHVHIDHSTDISVTDGNFSSTIPGMEDGVNSYFSTGVVVDHNNITGGSSPTGCGIVADLGSKNMTITHNNVSGQYNCGIGLSAGTGHRVDNNVVGASSWSGGWEMYAHSFNNGGCKNPVFRWNTSPQFVGDACGIVKQLGNSWN